MTERQQYQQQYRQRQKERLRIFEETKPGRYIRENPDYENIMAAIESERRESERV